MVLLMRASSSRGTLTTLRNVEDIVNAKRAISQLKELSCVESVIVEDVNKPKWYLSFPTCVHCVSNFGLV